MKKILFLIFPAILSCSSLVNLSGFSKDQLINNPKTAGYLEVINKCRIKGESQQSYGASASFDIYIITPDDDIDDLYAETVYPEKGDWYQVVKDKNTHGKTKIESYRFKMGKNYDYRYFVLKPGVYSIYAVGPLTKYWGNQGVLESKNIKALDEKIEKIVIEKGQTASVVLSFKEGTTDVVNNIYKRKNTIYDINKKELVQLNWSEKIILCSTIQ